MAAVAIGAALIVIAWPREASPHYPITTTVLFNREVAKIFDQKCVQCHAQNGMAVPLVTYHDARPWAVAIKEEILARRMPPWPAEQGYGDFANDIGLTGRERDFLLSWIDGGAPEGEVPRPPRLDHSGHWMLGAPDAVYAPTQGTVVRPGGRVGFTRIVIDTGLREDRWVRAIDYKPGDQRVTRAAFLRVLETGQYLGGWTPWRTAIELPAGGGIRVPARSHLTLDVLYQSAAETVVDAPRVGMYFTDRPAFPMTSVVAPHRILPATSAAARRVVAELPFRERSGVVEMWPEMSAGARSLEVKVRRLDGSSEVVLHVRNVRQEWPTSYVFRQPLVVPNGSKLQASAYFDPQAASPPRLTLTVNLFSDGPAGTTAAPSAAAGRFLPAAPRLPGSTR